MSWDFAPNAIDYFAALTIKRTPKISDESNCTAQPQTKPVLVSASLPNSSVRQAEGGTKQVTIRDAWQAAITDIIILSEDYNGTQAKLFYFRVILICAQLLCYLLIFRKVWRRFNRLDYTGYDNRWK